MTSFTLYALGFLGADPEIATENGRKYTRFCLVGSDCGAPDESQTAPETSTTIWLAAFGTLGTTIAQTAREGDLLFAQARVASHHNYAYIADGFTICAPADSTPPSLSSMDDQAPAGDAISCDESETAIA